MSAFDFLARVAARLSGAVDETVSSLEDLAQAVLENFEDGSEAFFAQARAFLMQDEGAFGQVNEALVALIEAVLDGDDVDGRLTALLDGWLGLPGSSTDDLVDLVKGLFGAFSNRLSKLIRVLRVLVDLIPSFEDLFLRLLIEGAKSPARYRMYLEQVLLPVTVAGLVTKGPDIVASALRQALVSDSSRLNVRTTVFSLGMPSAGLADAHKKALQHFGVGPRGSAMIALLLENLRRSAGLDGASVLQASPALMSICYPVISFFANIVNAYTEAIANAFRQALEELLSMASNSLDLEMRILEVARFVPPVGILLFKVALVVRLTATPAPFLNLVFNEIENDPKVRVKRLPRPSRENKYFILSDIHRDAHSDRVDDPYAIGSIHHFLDNAELLFEVLTYLEREGYTLIEAGDCEELWFFRDRPFDPVARLEEIIRDHKAIYECLARLHREGRYFRVFGNHDSYLRNPAVFEVLNRCMDPDGSAPFEIFDFIIIESVKTMHDVLFYLGLNSDPNEDTMPLVVTHGHQWDFWNCDENNILGKLIVTVLVTPLDMLDDPVRNLAGISSRGSPLVNFKDQLAKTPIYSVWQNYEPAVRTIDRIQHMADKDRRFTDDIAYSETLASLMGLLIGVQTNPDDEPRIRLSSGAALFNLLCIGHTHNPHNEPYYDLKMVPAVGEAVARLEGAVRALTGDLVQVGLGLVKSLFLNCGVSGWHEDCISGIDLGNESNATGQPKLIYWTYNTRIDRPNHMDWELPHIPPEGAQLPGEALKQVLADALSLLGSQDDRSTLMGAEPLSAPAPVAEVAALAADKWRAQNLKVSFDGRSARHIEQLVTHVLLGLLAPVKARETSEMVASVSLHPELARLLGQAMEDPVLPDRLPDDVRFVTAVQLVALSEFVSDRTVPSPSRQTGLKPSVEELAYLRTLVSLWGHQRLEMTFAAKDQEVSAQLRIRASGSKRPNWRAEVLETTE